MERRIDQNCENIVCGIITEVDRSATSILLPDNY